MTYSSHDTPPVQLVSICCSPQVRVVQVGDCLDLSYVLAIFLGDDLLYRRGEERGDWGWLVAFAADLSGMSFI